MGNTQQRLTAHLKHHPACLKACVARHHHHHHHVDDYAQQRACMHAEHVKGGVHAPAMQPTNHTTGMRVQVGIENHPLLSTKTRQPDSRINPKISNPQESNKKQALIPPPQGKIPRPRPRATLATKPDKRDQRQAILPSHSSPRDSRPKRDLAQPSPPAVGESEEAARRLQTNQPTTKNSERGKKKKRVGGWRVEGWKVEASPNSTHPTTPRSPNPVAKACHTSQNVAIAKILTVPFGKKWPRDASRSIRLID